MVGKLVSSSRGATYYWVERNKNPDAPYIVFTHGIAANHHLFDNYRHHLLVKNKI